jgi:hypothetical protein
MPTSAIVATVAVYIFTVLLVASLIFTSRWRWWIKAGAAVIALGLFVGTYFGIQAMLGWATTSEPPQRYALLWSKVVEPDKFTGAPGRVYLWTQAVDKDNVRQTAPRAYQVGFSQALVHQLDSLQSQRNKGEDVTVDATQLAELMAADPTGGGIIIGNDGAAATPAPPAPGSPAAEMPAASGPAVSPYRLSSATLSVPVLIVTVSAYVLISILLVSLNLTSRWRWWIKGAGIVVATATFIGAYFALDSMLGWPSEQPMPARYAILWTEVNKPDPEKGTAGAVYMWVEELDDENFPSGTPRSYALAYTEPLEEDAENAQEQIQAGEEIMGQSPDMTEEERLAQENKDKQMGPPNQNAELKAAADTVPFMDQGRLNVQALQPAIQPDKDGAL